MPLIEQRYAEALVNLAVQTGAVDGFQVQLQEITDVFNEQIEFKKFLLNPGVELKVKKDLIKKLFAGSSKIEIINFLLLILDKGRMKFLPEIYKEFVKQADKIRSTLNMTITSATLIDQKQLNALAEKYRILYGAAMVKVVTQLDTSLLGGVKVTIGDKVTDGTIKGRLEGLKELLYRG